MMLFFNEKSILELLGVEIHVYYGIFGVYLESRRMRFFGMEILSVIFFYRFSLRFKLKLI